MEYRFWHAWIANGHHYTINLNSAPSASSAQIYATQVANKGYGAIGYYDLRANNIVSVLNGVAKGAFNSTCTYDG